jgi:hypothetical protein
MSRPIKHLTNFILIHNKKEKPLDTDIDNACIASCRLLLAFYYLGRPNNNIHVNMRQHNKSADIQPLTLMTILSLTPITYPYIA